MRERELGQVWFRAYITVLLLLGNFRKYMDTFQLIHLTIFSIKIHCFNKFLNSIIILKH